MEALEITRYVNGREIKAVNLKHYIIDSDVILQSIAAVNKRLQLKAEDCPL